MVGLVLVSHSRALAQALVEFVRQMAPAEVPIAIAAGIGEDSGEFGTDASQIAEAIQSVFSPQGVIVLMDLGSAILSAELALELLPGEVRSRVALCAAPFVEGAMAAGVLAGSGADLATVSREAGKALFPKSDHFPVEIPEQETEAAAPIGRVAETRQTIALTLNNLHGLHARPAARFVQMARAFDADVQVTNLTKDKGPVNACSLNALMTLGAVKGDRIAITASGSQASAALEALTTLVRQGFPEGDALEGVPPPLEGEAIGGAVSLEGAIRGIPISEGIALGQAWAYQPSLSAIPETEAGDPGLEWVRLEQAIECTQMAIEQRRQRLQASAGEARAAILAAHELILEDPELLGRVRQRIYRDKLNAAQAWQISIAGLVEAYAALEDSYLQQRSADVADVGNQVLAALLGRSEFGRIEPPSPCILIARELTPSEMAQLDPGFTLGLVTESGGLTSHTAILARASGIPVVGGVDMTRLSLEAGTLVAIDGTEGLVWVSPAEDVKQALADQRLVWQARREAMARASQVPACTQDGRRIEVGANVGSLAGAQAAVKVGAEGIGVLRTEFLYLSRTSPPSEAEQFEHLRQIGQAMGDLPVIVRTLDAGGDKDLPYANLAVESNPYLGVRAIRLSLRQPELFHPQLRAILRAGGETNLRVMFPMVTNLEEVQQAKALLEAAHQELVQENLPHRWPIQTGIMVEVPSAALLSPSIAPHVDFFSIGTNDLTQYTLAAERGNPNLSEYADALHPAILRLIHQVVEAAHQAGKWAGVCGEIAGDPLATAVLVGLWVDELSMNPADIPAVKSTLRKINSTEASLLAKQAFACTHPDAVRSLAKAFLL